MIRDSKILVLLGFLGGVLLLSACNTVVDDAAEVSVGVSNSCLLTTGGAVECWGLADNVVPGGQSNTAVGVPGLESGVQHLTVGWESACVIQSAEVLCWGGNTRGQLGNGTLDANATPTPVLGLPAGEPIDVEMYYWTACALYLDGTVWCWGEGDGGEIGNGQSVDQLSAQQVALPDGGAETLAVGGNFGCVTVNQESVWCWGSGSGGQLGNGSYASSNVPDKVSGLGAVAELRAGYNHTCVLTTQMICWGRNGDGELGDGTTTNSNVPVFATAWAPSWATSPASIVPGGWRTCAVMTTDEVYCLGRDNFGANGNGPGGDGLMPSLMLDTDTTGVKTGDGHYRNSCVVDHGGGVRCVGFGGGGQLGDGLGMDSQVLVTVVR